MKNLATKSLAIGVYERIKGEIFDLSLLPGERFTENEVAERVGVSRTPVREALYRIARRLGDTHDRCLVAQRMEREAVRLYVV